MFEMDILKWEEEECVFLETHNFPSMLEKIRTQSYLTFVGTQGSGKSAIIHHIALKLRKEGYDILPIREIKDIETYCDPNNPQVFVIDDVVGVFGLDMSAFDALCRFEDRITKPIMPISKTLMTCREVVYRNEALASSFLSQKENVVHLHSDENALSDQDKYNLLAKYNLEMHLLSADKLSKTSRMFPFLCKMFAKKNEFQVYGQNFFISPIPCILQILDKMKVRNKMQYASLVLLMANQNKLSELKLSNEDNCEGTTEFNDIKFRVLKGCKVNTRTDNYEIINALLEMEGTYTQKSGSVFIFIHDSMFEIIAYHFGSHYPEFILQCMSSDYIANYIKVDVCLSKKRKRKHDLDRNTSAQHDGMTDLRVRLQEPYIATFSERLFRDVENGEFFNVFGNEFLKHPYVLEAFMKVMSKKTFQELCVVFLLDSKENERDKQKHFKIPVNHFSYLISVNRYIRDRCKKTISAINFVIYYGHCHIFQYIIDETLKHNDNIDILFQNYHNIGQSMYTDSKSSESGKEKDSAVDQEMTKKFSKKRESEEKSQRDSDAESVHNSETESDTDCDIVIDIASEINSNEGNESSCETQKELLREPANDEDTEKVNFEKRRFLCLGCCSGDLNTVKILLKHVQTDSFRITAGKNKEFFTKENPLELACKFGYVDIVMELLKVDHFTLINKISLRPLKAAIENDHFDICELLIKKGADVNLSKSESLLTNACNKGSVVAVDKLIKYGALVNKSTLLTTPLLESIGRGHLSIVKKLINAGADVNLVSILNTPLVAACSNGNLEIVEELIKSGADLNLHSYLSTPLETACYKGHLDIVTMLIKKGADVNGPGMKNTPLTAAIHSGHSKIVDELIKMEADVNLDYFGNTPLSSAIRRGNSNVVNNLIKAGADVNLHSFVNTPLTTAIRCGHFNIVKKLIEEGAGVNVSDKNETPLTAACMRGHLDIVEMLLYKGADVNLEDGEQTPLTIACYMGDFTVVEKLIKAGADVNLHDSNSTPLIAACCFGNIHVVKELIKAGANVNHKFNQKSPLSVARCYKHLNVINELKKITNDVNDVYNTISLSDACQCGYLNVAEGFIKCGVDVNETDGINTPLIAACCSGNLSLVEKLIQVGADVDLDFKGKTPLITACENGQLDIVRELIQAGADIFQRYEDNSPLTAACCKGHLHVVEELIEAGINVDRGSFYEKPISVACKYGHLIVVKKLIEHHVSVELKNEVKMPLLNSNDSNYVDIVATLLEAGMKINSEEKKQPSTSWSILPLNLLKVLQIDENDFKTPDGGLIQELRECEAKIKDIIKAEADVNKRVGYETLLTAACKDRSLDIVEYLITAGADVNLKYACKTPLTTACNIWDLRIAQKLIKAGANVNLSNGYKTPLTIACDVGYVKLVKELIKEKADVNIACAYKTPLTAACEHGFLHVVKTLINAGADVNLKDRTQTPLVAACSMGCINIVSELVKAGADVNLMGRFGSPLLIASREGYIHVVKQLIKVGADVNQMSQYGTALFHACNESHLSVVKCLIESGADISLGNKYNTPLQVTYDRQIVKELEKAIIAKYYFPIDNEGVAILYTR